MEGPVPQALTRPAHEQMEHRRVGRDGHAVTMAGNAGMVLEELFQEARQIATDGFLQGLSLAMAGSADTADDVGPKGTLAVDGRRRRQDLAIGAVDEGCG